MVKGFLPACFISAFGVVINLELTVQNNYIYGLIEDKKAYLKIEKAYTIRMPFVIVSFPSVLFRERLVYVLSFFISFFVRIPVIFFFRQ